MGVEILPGDGRVEVGRAVLHRQAIVVVTGPAQKHRIRHRIYDTVDSLPRLLKQRSENLVKVSKHLNQILNLRVFSIESSSSISSNFSKSISFIISDIADDIANVNG